MTQDEVIQALIVSGDEHYRFARKYLAAAGFSIPRDGVEARRWCEEQAVLGNNEASYVLVRLLTAGLFGPQDKTRALRCLEQASARGYLPALLMLAGFHESGWGGLQRNPQRAVVITKQAIDKGHAPAMVSLAAMYETGHNVPKDTKKATELYERAARLGDPAAQCFLACEKLESPDAAEVASAIELLNKSAAQGYASAHRHLGYTYMGGAAGIVQDKERSRFHFDEAERLERA